MSRHYLGTIVIIEDNIFFNKISSGRSIKALPARSTRRFLSRALVPVPTDRSRRSQFHPSTSEHMLCSDRSGIGLGMPAGSTKCGKAPRIPIQQVGVDSSGERVATGRRCPSSPRSNQFWRSGRHSFCQLLRGSGTGRPRTTLSAMYVIVYIFC